MTTVKTRQGRTVTLKANEAILVWTNDGWIAGGEPCYKVYDRGQRNDGYGRYFTVRSVNGVSGSAQYSDAMPSIVNETDGTWCGAVIAF